MTYIKHILDKRTQKIKRVLSFGKYKNNSISEIAAIQFGWGKHGYLRWCLDNIKGFENELTPKELEIAQRDYYPFYTNSHSEMNDYEGPGAWLDASDGSLYCGFASTDDMF